MAGRMIDFYDQNISFRGYPVSIITERCWEELANVDSKAPFLTVVMTTLSFMEDTAGPDEPSDWLFEARLPAGGRVWLQRGGGMRGDGAHRGGYWTLMLPEDM